MHITIEAVLIGFTVYLVLLFIILCLFGPYVSLGLMLASMSIAVTLDFCKVPFFPHVFNEASFAVSILIGLPLSFEIFMYGMRELKAQRQSEQKWKELLAEQHLAEKTGN